MDQVTEQCMAIDPVPFFYKEQFTYPVCVLPKNHEGAHKSSVAYDREWVRG